MPTKHPESVDWQPPLEPEAIEAICQHAFGNETGLIAYEQFHSDTVYLVYRLSLAGRLPVILRVAPPADVALPWDLCDRLRREQAMRPFFAPIAELTPTPLFVDFTHQVIDRDYVIQTFIEGDRWERLARALSPAEARRLWHQFGQLMRRIHTVRGVAFGDPLPGRQFACWSEALLHRLGLAQQELERLRLRAESQLVEQARATLAQRREVFDAVGTPHLLHGGLWLNNLLLRWVGDERRIVGVLDADRAWWGDPAADWTMFVLASAATAKLEPYVDQFWAGYGEVEQGPAAAFRAEAYAALHLATALGGAAREQDTKTLARGRHNLSAVVERLATGGPVLSAPTG